MWDRRGSYMVLVGRPDTNSHLEDPCVARKIILKRFFKK